MKNWKERLADMLVGYRHNFTLREQLENFISQELEKAREEGRRKPDNTVGGCKSLPLVSIGGKV